MQDIILWLKLHWQYVSAGVIVLVNILLFLLKKKPIKVFDSVIEKLLVMIPQFVIAAEEHFTDSGSGSDKLTMVVGLCFKFLEASYPGIDTEAYDGLIRKYVELILSTPKKKGE